LNDSRIRQDIHAAFVKLDDYLASQLARPLWSLSPERNLVRSFSENAPLVLQACNDPDVCLEIAEQFKKILKAQLENFPENIFWDLDYLLLSMATVSQQGHPHRIAAVREMGNKIVDLLTLFGEKTAIRFRYVHDFTYGFDWAKWVKKNPAARQNILPFSMEFLDALAKRGEELLALIEANDRKYHKLPDENHRNPFVFSREPQDEQQLLTCLAKDGHVPIPVWDFHAQPQWMPPFAELRKQCSVRLGITKEQA